MELQPFSFDLAVQQKGNNGRRSPKGERLRMSVGIGSEKPLCPPLKDAVISSKDHIQISRAKMKKNIQIRP